MSMEWQILKHTLAIVLNILQICDNVISIEQIRQMIQEESQHIKQIFKFRCICYIIRSNEILASKNG